MTIEELGSPLDKVGINGSQDVVISRFKAKQAAEKIGFGGRDLIRISTAVSELARNIVQHARSPGSISLFHANKNGAVGIGILAEDTGKGISNPESVLQQAGTIMSGGLFGTKRISDEFAIESAVARGTRVYFIKWLK